MKFLTIGSANSRRVKFWTDALKKNNFQYELLTYQQILNGEFPKIIVPTTLRITSPGEDFEIKKELLKLGGYPNANDLNFEKGLIYPNQFWYKGWITILNKIHELIQANPLLKVMNNPKAIQLAFHKLECQKLLSNQQTSMPNILIDRVLGYYFLINSLQKLKIFQVFIKPYHGSSASGVMAFRQTPKAQILYTTIDLKPMGLYNNLKLKQYTNQDAIRSIINKMIPSGLMVEEWIPKKKYQEKSVDFRVLVVNGKADFIIPRMSKHFITNLHLGNEKGKVSEIEQVWGTQIIQKIKSLAIDAVIRIGGLFYAGVDIAVSKNETPYVLEINAFGDLLLNISHDNLNAYEYELKEWISFLSLENGGT